ncbi:MAG: lipase [Rhodospirillales bacterium]|jgi:hypothetical protein|nr:lipase [Rhodospirillales bacterium]
MIAHRASASSRRSALGTLTAAGLSSAVSPAQAEAEVSGRPGHVVLLGDSVFDNAAYVAGGPDVVNHLRRSLPAGWQATLAALDGAVTADVRRQLSRVPAGATHLVVSAGGNDALRAEAVLAHPVHNVAEGLERLAQARERFVGEYHAMLDAVFARGLPIVLCTIYDPRFQDRLRQRLAVAGLALFNDVIIRAALSRRLSMLDLRLVCSEDADFANPIEPSIQGGQKIAAAIADMVLKQTSG